MSYNDKTYIFCDVMLNDDKATLYYISPFEDIEVGDTVSVNIAWYGMTEGVVTGIRQVTEKTAPFPISRTKKIEKIVLKAGEARKELLKPIDRLVSENSSEPFFREAVSSEITAKYEKCTYFASAVFRGFEIDVCDALRVIHPRNFDVTPYMHKVGEGIYQFECESGCVPKIIKQFPALKGVFFAENWKEKQVYLAFSESGYDTVTDYRLIGNCDFYSRDRWTLINDPTQKVFTCDCINYEFSELDKWEKCDYVLPDKTSRLISDVVIPAKPYKKKSLEAPCEIVKIIYPE